MVNTVAEDDDRGIESGTIPIGNCADKLASRSLMSWRFR